ALLPLVVAVVFALFMLVTRQIAKQTDPVSLQAISGVGASAVLLPVLLMGTQAGVPDLSLVVVLDNIHWLLLAIGVLGTVAHLLMTWSLRYAPSATLAPMQYLEIPVATLIGWMIFYDLPDGKAALGILITIAAGLYVILRERAIGRSAPTETPA
ncbi:MAG: EamA family transporter, partial [Pseudomonadota bacterium]